MNRNRELWAMALWVEKHHGEAGMRFIAEQIDRNRSAGEEGGVDIWLAVERRYAGLTNGRGVDSSLSKAADS